jgi:hypothetical protein
MIDVEMCRRDAAWNLLLISASLAIIITQGTSAAGLAPSPAAPSASTPQAAPGAAEPKQTTPTEPPKFEVSTVKASKPDPGNSMMMFTPDGISITSFRLDMVVREAFGVNYPRPSRDVASVGTRKLSSPDSVFRNGYYDVVGDDTHG